MVQVYLFPVVESQSPRQRISNVDRNFFANPESFAGWLAGCSEYLEIICIIRKTSRWSWELSDDIHRKSADGLQRVQMICNVSR